MASSIPLAVHALINIATGAFPANYQVWFGKPLPVYTAPITLQILGVHPATQEIITMGPDYKREEVYEIECLLTSWAGDVDYLGRMDEVFATFDLLTTAIGNNPNLNQTVRFAEIATLDYVPDATAVGTSLGSLAFTIKCQQRISSLT
jgi:hypothetical protein